MRIDERYYYFKDTGESWISKLVWYGVYCACLNKSFSIRSLSIRKRKARWDSIEQEKKDIVKAGEKVFKQIDEIFKFNDDRYTEERRRAWNAIYHALEYHNVFFEPMRYTFEHGCGVSHRSVTSVYGCCKKWKDDAFLIIEHQYWRTRSGKFVPMYKTTYVRLHIF